MIVKIDELKCILFKKCMPHRHHLDARDIALKWGLLKFVYMDHSSPEQICTTFALEIFQKSAIYSLQYINVKIRIKRKNKRFP